MSETPLDLDGARVRSDLVIDGTWQPSSEENFRSWAEVLARDSRELIAEVDRLRAENVALRSAYREIAALWAKELNDARDAGGLTVCHNLGCMVIFHATDKCPACNDEPAKAWRV